MLKDNRVQVWKWPDKNLADARSFPNEKYILQDSACLDTGHMYQERWLHRDGMYAGQYGRTVWERHSRCKLYKIAFLFGPVRSFFGTGNSTCCITRNNVGYIAYEQWWPNPQNNNFCWRKVEIPLEGIK